MKKQIEIFHHDNPFRFRAVSRTRPDIEHVVDVSAYNGIGKCSCEHFTFNLEPALREGILTGDAARCAHIKAARETCLDGLLARITQKEKDNE